MDIPIRNSTSSIDLDNKFFAKPFNESLIHQVVVAYLAKARAGTKAQKTRAEVRGGGAKPFRQKGTGRARAGTIRSPIWRGGGVTFASKPRSFSQKVNKKMYRAAICSIFSELIRQDRLLVIQSRPYLELPKTRQLLIYLESIGLFISKKDSEIQRILIIVEEFDTNLHLAARNLRDIAVINTIGINPVNLIGSHKIVITTSAIQLIKEWLM